MDVLELDKVKVDTPKQERILPNLSIGEKARNEIAEKLKSVLADSYCLMLMTQNYHWNVKGINFKPIHELTEEQYENLFEAIDEVAERIRALGHDSPGTMAEFNDLTTINLPNKDLSEKEMIIDLLEANETMVSTLRKALNPASEAEDEATVDLITERLIFHEKVSWMWRSHLER